MIEGFWDIEMAARGAFMIWWYLAIVGALLLNLWVAIIILNPRIVVKFTKWYYKKSAKIMLTESDEWWIKHIRINFGILFLVTLSLLILVLKARLHI